MGCPNPLTMYLEITLSVTYLGWVGFWFCVGHLISMPVHSCKSGWDDCAFFEPIGLIFMFASSMVYFYIAKAVLSVIFDKKLPSGEKFADEMTNIFKAAQQNSKNGKKRK